MCDPSHRDPSSRTVLAGYVFTGMTTMFFLLNVILVYLLVREKKYRRTYHLAYLNLAISDCFFALFGAVIRGPGIVWGFQSKTHCDVSMYLAYIITYTNLLAVVPITIDRVVAVLLPTKYEDKLHFLIVQVGIAGSWITSSIYLGVMMFTATRVTDTPIIEYRPNCLTDCRIRSWRYGDLFSWIANCTFMFCPLLVNLVSYILIIRHLRQRDQSHRRSRNNLLILTRAILICTIFTVSWVPSIIITDILHLDNNFNLMMLGKFFFYINCLSDPVLYTFSNNVISTCLDRFVTQVAPLKVKYFNGEDGSSSGVIRFTRSLHLFTTRASKDGIGSKGHLPRVGE